MLVWVACDRSVATRMFLCAFSKKNLVARGTPIPDSGVNKQKKTTQMLA